MPTKIRLDLKYGGLSDDSLSKRDIFDYREALDIKNEVKKLKKEQDSRIYRDTMLAPETTRCVVVEPFGEDSGEVHLLAIRFGGQDEHIWQDLDELPDHLRRELMDKDEDDVVEAVLRTDRFGDLYIKDLPRVQK